MAVVIACGACAISAVPALAAPPLNTVPGDQSINEDAVLTFTGANAISVSDADPTDLEVALSVSNGVVTLDGTSGLTVTGGGNGSASVAVVGPIADLNAALDGMTLTPSLHFNGTAALTVMTTDGVDSDSDNVNITVNAVNDAPVNTVPGSPQTAVEDTPKVFSGANAISIADVDAGGNNVQVGMNTNIDGAPSGTVTLGGIAGLTFTTGDGTADPAMVFQGTMTDVNAALDGLSFTANQDKYGTGAARLTVNTSDLGNSPSPAKTDNGDVVSFDITPVDDDPPIPSLPPGVGTYRNLSKTLSLADRNQIKVEDPDFPDAGTTVVEVALESTHGTMTLGSTAGLTITSGANGSSAMTLQGLQSDINGALDGGLTFGVEPGFTGQATIEVTTDDLTALDPAPQANDTFEIEVDQPEEAAYWVAAKESVPPTRNAALVRAELDGGGGADLVTGPELFDTPAATAIDSVEGRIYWMNTGAFNPTQDGIWSTNLDGTDKQLFLSDSDTPPLGLKPPPAGVHLNAGSGMVIDQDTRRIYWANTGISGIYWVSLDDIAIGGQVSTGAATVSTPDALALDLENDRVIWTNVGGLPATHRISYAPLPPTAATPANSGNFNITGAGVNSSAAGNSPNGVAVDLSSDPDRLYWTLGNGGAATDRLRYADLPATFGTSRSTDLTGQVFNISPNPGGGLRTPAIDPDANRIYWASGSDRISYANPGRHRWRD